MTSLLNGYVIDTDAILHLVKRQYPKKVFLSLHDNIDNLINQGCLVSCAEVLNELEAAGIHIPGDDPVLEWAHMHNGIFQELNPTAEEILADIMENHPDLVKTKSGSGFDADAMLIAVAAEKGWKLITYENRAGAASKEKIPNVADAYSVECILLPKAFEELGWKI